MKKFNALEIQNFFEEKRIILGKKFEEFLLKKLAKIASFFGKIFAAPNFYLFGCLVIFLVKILISSTRDIGNFSAENILQNSFIHSVIATEISFIALAILSIFACNKILRRGFWFKEKIAFDVVILSFCASLCWRVFAFQLNDFFTIQSLSLALLFPYFSYHLIEKQKITKVDQALIFILAASLILSDWRYVILVAFLELKKIPKIFLKSLLALISIIFLALNWGFFSLEILNLNIFKSYSTNFFQILKEDIFPIFFIIASHFFIKTTSADDKKNNVRKNSDSGFLEKFYPQFLLLFLASILIAFCNFKADLQQRSLLYSLNLPLICLIILSFIQQGFFNFKKHWLYFLIIIFLPQFDQKNIFSISLDLGLFWWVFVLAIYASIKKSNCELQLNKSEKFCEDSFLFLQKIFLPHKDSWLLFAALATLTFFLSLNKKAYFLLWIFCTILLVLLIWFYENFHQKVLSRIKNDDEIISEKESKKTFSLTFAMSIFLAISYLISFYVASFFNLNNIQISSSAKSPNDLSDQVFATIKNLNAEDKKVLFLKNSKDLGRQLIYGKTKISEELTQKPFLVIAEISKEKLCEIGFLELLFRNENSTNFKKNFLHNYVFSNRILTYKTQEKEIDFLKDQQKEKLKQNLETLSNQGSKESPRIIEHEFEVYVARKN